MKSNFTTLQNWDKLAQQYQDKFMEMDLYNATYDRFCEAIAKEKATILELGCGPGNITKYLIDTNPNYKILATDTAPSMIELGKINVPKANFQLLDARDILTLKQKFDAIMCGFVFPYLNQKEIEKFITNSKQLLNNNGILYFSCIEKEKAYSETQTSSDGKFQMEVHYHEASFLLQLLEQNNFNLVAISRIDYPKPASHSDIHLVIIAQKKN